MAKRSEGGDSSRRRSAMHFLRSIPIASVQLDGDAEAPGVEQETEGGPGLSVVTYRLPGPESQHISSKGQRGTQHFRTTLLRDDVLDGRVFFSRRRWYPTVTFSVVQYNPRTENLLLQRRRRMSVVGLPTADSEEVPHWVKWRGKSYAKLLNTTLMPSAENRGGRIPYDPLFLDDPSLDLAHKRSVQVRHGYRMSIIPYQSKRTLRQDMNTKFRARMVEVVDPSMSLSKIRHLKRAIGWLWHKLGKEMSTVALAIVYLERLVLQRVVNKANRRLIAAACLFMAYKFNEPQDLEALPALWGEIERLLSVSRKDVLRLEFSLYVELGFYLHVRLSDVLPHWERVLQELQIGAVSYIGEANNAEFQSATLDELRCEPPSPIVTGQLGDWSDGTVSPGSDRGGENIAVVVEDP